MRFYPDSLAGRTIAIMVIGITLFHVASLWVYQSEIDFSASGIGDTHAAEHIRVTAHAVAKVPAPERDALARILSVDDVEVRWSALPLVATSTLPEAALDALRRTLEAPAEIRAAQSAGGLNASVGLEDGSWLNFSVRRLAPPSDHFDLVRSTTAMAFGVALVSILLVRSLTRPFRILAESARRLGRDMTARPIPERGPREMRAAAVAFNEMQDRIRRLIDDRTQTLAAISHDLKTPITRLRLRAEFVSDSALKQKLVADLDEMETMIGSTLAFLRGDASGEPSRRFDLAALIATVCNDLADAGHDVRYVGPRHAPFHGRPLGLKRALANVVDNAVKYGTRAEVSLVESPSDYRVVVEDEGPGIAPAVREAVFRPFYRLERSRNRTTGGTGLGLTVARTIVRGHGGDVLLDTAPSRQGLRVVIALPRHPIDDHLAGAQSNTVQHIHDDFSS